LFVCDKRLRRKSSRRLASVLCLSLAFEGVEAPGGLRVLCADDATARELAIPRLIKESDRMSVTGDPLVGGTGFTVINQYFPFTDKFAATQWLANYVGAAPTTTTGAQLSLTLPSVRIPAAVSGSSSGDHWYFLRIRAPLSSNSSSNSIAETILGYTGAGMTNSPGGGVQFQPVGLLVGADSTGGAQVDTMNAGRMIIRRQAASSWQLFAPASSSPPAGAPQMAAGQAYGLCVGIKNNGTADYGRIVLATVNGSTPQSLSATTASNNSRPTSQTLFPLIGALGDPDGAANFGGEVSDLWIVNGPFPTDAQIQQITNGQVTVASVVATQGGTIQYANSLDFSTVSGGVIPATAGYPVTAGVTVRGQLEPTWAPLGVSRRCGRHGRPSLVRRQQYRRRHRSRAPCLYGRDVLELDNPDNFNRTFRSVRSLGLEETVPPPGADQRRQPDLNRRAGSDGRWHRPRNAEPIGG
jgi:hypothetical protein